MTDVFREEIGSMQQDSVNRFKAVGELIKGQQEQISDLKEHIEKIESQSAGRKSITTKNFLEKSFANTVDEDESTKFNKTYSVSSQKALISEALTDDFLSKGGTDQSYQQAILAFDQAKVVSPLIRAKAKELLEEL